jgi:uncharacterized membrane protein YjjP (DUF1212 family)
MMTAEWWQGVVTGICVAMFAVLLVQGHWLMAVISGIVAITATLSGPILLKRQDTDVRNGAPARGGKDPY